MKTPVSNPSFYDDNVYHYPNNGDAPIRDLLIGESIEEVDGDIITLSDGTMFRLQGNKGGCVCSAGDYRLVALNHVDNIITNVRVGIRDHSWSRKTYEIFVLTDAIMTEETLARFEGDDGSGYYGTGFWIEVLSYGS